MFNFIKILFTAAVLMALTLTFGAIYLNASLPNVDELTETKLQVPLSVYTKDGKLISQFGEYRRNPVKLADVPQGLINAVLATEDHRFYQHTGVDLIGLTRAAHHMLMEGGRGQGGSTITMQVARNFYLSPEKTFIRKFNEILLALKIEREFTKDQILELYLNKIYLGSRAYGVVAAAQVYYGKSLDQLTLPEMAMIAGLPQAPSRLNPINNPTGAKARRTHVLNRMYDYGYIDKAQHDEAVNAPLTEKYHGPRVEVDAPYVAEMVRQLLYNKMGDKIYIDGLKAYTTIESQEQLAANTALENGLLAYDRRHGYRGPIALNADLARLKETSKMGPLIPALVTKVTHDSVQVILADEQTITLNWKGLSWARKDLGQGRVGYAPKEATEILKKDALIYILKNTDDNTYRLAQVPQVQGAIVAMDPKTGGITALVGGFDFYENHFNAATQAKRQPGSSFKPFIYSAALANGFKTTSIINDAPIVIADTPQTLWRPQNDDERFFGPTSLRMGLVMSVNLVSIRLLDAIGIDTLVEYASRFGFDPKTMPRGLSLALGTLDTTPLEMTTAYSVFANGGYKVTPHVFDYLTDENGVILMKNEIAAPMQVISPENAYITTDILKDVIKRGTGRGALVLERGDLAGKTGSTNDHRDAWFVGFNADRVASVWFGFDRNRTLGKGEYGAQTALPVWINFMREALKDKPQSVLAQPQDVVFVRINKKTGNLASSNDPDAIFEIFTLDTAPTNTNSNSSSEKWVNPANIF
ncbi:MAG: penicillin-binding protein 1A [Legionellales bacterium]|jgi:penicillin-binding protein 1A